MRRRLTFFLYVGMTIIMLLLVGCGSSGNEAGSEENSDADSLDYELFPTTHVLQGDQASELSEAESDGTLTFAAGSTFVNTLQVPHILIVSTCKAAPQGALLQVETIEPQADGTTRVTTKPAALQRAFKRLHLKMQRPVIADDSDVKWTVAPGTTVSGPSMNDEIRRKTGGKDFGPFTIDYYPFNGDHDTATSEDQVHVVASFYGGVHYVFGIDFDWPDWGDALSGDVLPAIEAGFYLKTAAGASMKADGVAVLAYARTDKLAEASLGSFAIGPLVFTVNAELNSRLEGKAKSRFELAGGADASFEVGAKFSTDDGGKLIPPTPSFTTDPVTVLVTEDSYLRLSVGPRIKLQLYGVVGPYAGLRVYGDLGAQNGASVNPAECWAFQVGIEGEVGVQIDLFGATLADWGDTFGIVNETVAKGECQADPAITNSPDLMDPTFTPWSQRLVDDSWPNTDTQPLVSLEPSVDDTWMLCGTTAKALTKLTKDGQIVWMKSYTRADATLPIPLEVRRAVNTKDVGYFVLAGTPTEILKLDGNGDLEWNLLPQFSQASNVGLVAALQDDDGNMYVGGAVADDTMQEDGWIFKMDPYGKVLWSKTFGVPSLNEWITGLALLDGDLVVVGERYGDLDPDPHRQAFIMRLTTDGTPRWMQAVKGCGDTDSLQLNAVQASQSGDIIVGGSYGLGRWHAILAKFKAADGSLGWVNGADNSGTLGLDMSDFRQLTDGGYLMAGQIWMAAPTNHVWIARSDSIGRPTWMKRLDDGGDDGEAAVALTGDGGALLAGQTSIGTQRSSFWVSRVPVKTGAITLPTGGTETVSDETYSQVESPCLSLSPDTFTLTDFPVTWSADSVIVTDVTPVVAKLL